MINYNYIKLIKYPAQSMYLITLWGEKKVYPQHLAYITGPYGSSLSLTQKYYSLSRFMSTFYSFLKRFICLFLQRGKRREKEGEENINVREISISCLLHDPS